MNGLNQVDKKNTKNVVKKYAANPPHPNPIIHFFFGKMVGNMARLKKNPPMNPPRCPSQSTPDENDERIVKNTIKPMMQHKAPFKSPRASQFINIYAKYTPITPQMMVEDPALT